MPTVSIGLPVYNGEKYIRQAIDSILAQTYRDFELIISDNASDDATREICEEYAGKDPRIIYHRQDVNMGAAPNFNFTFKKARGKYFKWVASDDIIDPSFLAECVSVMEENHHAPLCCAWVERIDESGATRDYQAPMREFFSPLAPNRLSAQVKMGTCYEIFGLIRHSALAKSDLIYSGSHGDGLLLAQLNLTEPFVEVPKHLLRMRIHPNQSMTKFRNDRVRYAEWFDHQRKGSFILPFFEMHWRWVNIVLKAEISVGDKVTCIKIISRSAWKKRRRMWKEAIGSISAMANRSQNVFG